MQIVLRDIVRRSVAALDREVSSPSPQHQEEREAGYGDKETQRINESSADTSFVGKQIITTEDELLLFDDVKSYFDNSGFSKRDFFNKNTNKYIKAEVLYIDSQLYFSIYITNPSMWIIRAAVESKIPWIGFNIIPDDGDKIIPAGYTKLLPCPHSKFRISYDKKQMAQPFSNLIALAIQKVLEE